MSGTDDLINRIIRREWREPSFPSGVRFRQNISTTHLVISDPLSIQRPSRQG